MKAALTFIAVLLALAPSQAGAQSDYVIGPQDVLAITVYNEDSLSGRYTVEVDGTLSFPLIGRVTAGGRTLREFEEHLKERLADGYFKRPQVTVSVEQYRSQRIFVMGEVRQPGTYPLTGDMTLIEALSRVGLTDAAAHEVVIVRNQAGTDHPVLPGEEGATQVIKVDMEAIRKGDLSKNVPLLDGDTIFVGRNETDFFYIYGEVKQPGVFPLKPEMTVLQALSLAGGLTPYAAGGRIKILRVIDGEKKELKAKLDDVIQPGDTIVVPERRF